MFGWIILIAILFVLLVKRGDLLAFIGKLSYAKRDYPTSMKWFRLAYRVGPLNFNNQMQLGYVCLRCGELVDARRFLQLCKDKTSRGSAARNQIQNLMALLYWKEGDLDEAIEILEDLLDYGYQTSVVYENLGIFYNLKEDKEKALDFNLKAYDYNSDSHIICDNLAESYAHLGQYEKAEEVYGDLIEKEPRFPEAYYGYGEVLLALGKKDEAVAMIEQALDKPFSYLSIRPKEYAEALLEKAKNA